MSLHPGVTDAQVREDTGWDVRFAAVPDRVEKTSAANAGSELADAERSQAKATRGVARAHGTTAAECIDPDGRAS